MAVVIHVAKRITIRNISVVIRIKIVVLVLLVLVAEFISPIKFTLSVLRVGTLTPKSVKCIHSATK